MRKNTIIISLIAALIFIAFIPIIIDWGIIGNQIPSNLSNSDWVGFLGSYIGAVLGSAVTLIGIVITIRCTNEQNKLDRELQVRPYCAMTYVDNNKLRTDKILGCFAIGCKPESNNGPEHRGVLHVKNIGVGSAIEFHIVLDKIDDGREHYPIILQRDLNDSVEFVNLLQSGEEAAIEIMIDLNFDKINEDDFIDTGLTDFRKYVVKNEVLRKYKDFDIVINVTYNDMYQNKYYQKVTLSSSIYASGKINEKQAEFACDMRLKDVTRPMKIKSEK